MKPKFPTLVEALRSAAANTPATTGYIFHSQTESNHLSFQKLWNEAQGYAATLQQQGVNKGDRVLLTWPTSPDFARLYMAIQCCGAVPCVLPTPGGRGQSGTVQQILAIANQIEAYAIIVSDHEVSLFTEAPTNAHVWSAADLKMGHPATWTPVCSQPDDLAVIQATSGSTGTPKCVALTHQNVLTNLEQIGQRLAVVEEDVVVGWLPLNHDMGLIGCFLFAAYWQLTCVLMSPLHFLRRPVNWLRAISEYGGSLSPAPNFALALTTNRTAAAELESLDLSHWRAVICGAEPIDVAVLTQFAQHLQPAGFNPQALVPAYGMAEAAVCVTMTNPGEPLRYETISRTALAYKERAIPLEDAAAADATTICDCGTPVAGTQIGIVDEADRPLPDGHVGRIKISGPSLMQSYFNLPEVTAQQMRNGWLDSGDLGYVRAGRLFVTGRSKEIIIIRGHNYAPTDFERAAAEVPGVASGRVVALGLPDPQPGTEQLVLFCEQSGNGTAKNIEALNQTIQVHVGKQTGVLPAQVVWIPRNAIPRTTSGKLQRNLLKQLYLNGVYGS